MLDLKDPRKAVAWLRKPSTVRERCGLIYEAARRDALTHFALDEQRLAATAEFVLETVRQAYPSLEIPYHSRWRHFAVGGKDRWTELARGLTGLPPEEVARIRIDLAVTSVLLDAGAGPAWRYREPGTSDNYARSEGLAVASFHLFAQGLFSARPEADPLRADAAGLAATTPEKLASAFQAGPDNPLVGLEGRTALLQRLAGVLRDRPDYFGSGEPRIGSIFDALCERTESGVLPAGAILDAVLEALGPIWPGRQSLGGTNLGDVWKHSAAANDDLTDDLTDGLVPFHKLSQWLTYSLVEPIQDAGIPVTGLEALTGLAEYRNGGLFLDLGVLKPKHDAVLGRPHPADSELVVEWRALTVVLLDRLAERIRSALGLSAAELPLAKVLEGGSWSAGRRIARQMRDDGRPPIELVSDGTVF